MVDFNNCHNLMTCCFRGMNRLTVSMSKLIAFYITVATGTYMMSRVGLQNNVLDSKSSSQPSRPGHCVQKE